jgi:hypothetical protein
MAKPPKAGPARRIIPHGEVYASIAFTSGAAEAAYRVKDVPQPQSSVMLWFCLLAMVFGIVWGGFRLVVPRNK